MQKQSVVPAFKYLKITTHVNSSVRVVSTYEGDSNNALKIRELEFDSFSARLDGCGPGAKLRRVLWVHRHPRKKNILLASSHFFTVCAPPK